MAYVCFIVDAFSRRIVGWRVGVEHAHRHGPRRARDGPALTRQPPPRRARRPTPTPGRSSRRCASPNASTRSAPDPRSAPSPTATTTRWPRRPTGSTRPSASTGPTPRGHGTTSTSSSSPRCRGCTGSTSDRLHGHCDDVPPAEFEAAFYAAQQPDPDRGWKPIARASIRPRAVQNARSARRSSRSARAEVAVVIGASWSPELCAAVGCSVGAAAPSSTRTWRPVRSAGLSVGIGKAQIELKPNAVQLELQACSFGGWLVLVG